MRQPMHGRFDFTRAELWADGAVHVLGIALGMGAVAILIARVLATASLADLMSVAIYSVALIAVLSVSALYNMWPVSPMKGLLRRLDHSAIYVLIAGTYTPFLMKLSEAVLAQALLAAVWIASLAGVLLKLALPGRFERVSIVLYLCLGWSGVIVWDRVAQFPAVTLWLMLAGGVLYTVGVLFHVWRSLPFQNAIWHVFVLVASGCFYGAVLATYGLAPSA